MEDNPIDSATDQKDKDLVGTPTETKRKYQKVKAEDPDSTGDLKRGRSGGTFNGVFN